MKPSIKSLDDEWTAAVKKRDGYKCVHCDKVVGLNAHHIFSRSKRSTRWYLLNGILLCCSCHMLSSGFSAHKTPTEFTEWVKEYLGEKQYDQLRQKAYSIDKRPLDEIQNDLKFDALHIFLTE